jgi:DNA-directed RNA polymerase II subunit RPB3
MMQINTASGYGQSSFGYQQ